MVYLYTKGYQNKYLKFGPSFHLNAGAYLGGGLWGPGPPGSPKGRQKERKKERERKREGRKEEKKAGHHVGQVPAGSSREENVRGAKLRKGREGCHAESMQFQVQAGAPGKKTSGAPN